MGVVDELVNESFGLPAAERRISSADDLLIGGEPSLSSFPWSRDHTLAGWAAVPRNARCSVKATEPDTG
jgi:hypothetical protein